MINKLNFIKKKYIIIKFFYLEQLILLILKFKIKEILKMEKIYVKENETKTLFKLIVLFVICC